MEMKPAWLKRFEDMFENHFGDRERSRLITFIQEELDRHGEEERDRERELIRKSNEPGIVR